MRYHVQFLLALALLAPSCAGGIGEVSGSGKEGSTGINPFKGVNFFINPDYAANVEATAAKHPDEAARIRKVASTRPACGSSDIKSVDKSPGLARRSQEAAGCQRQADPDGGRGLRFAQPRLLGRILGWRALGRRKTAKRATASEFIDPIAAQFKAHPSQPIVVILEPDSLGNMATNMAIPKCQKAKSAYRNGIVYAIKSFHLPNVSVYLDAAHAGWLGWDDNRAKIAKVFKNVLNEAGGPQMIRGFATNTSNYTHLSNRDGAVLEPSNPCPNELTYVKMLRKTLEMYGFKDHHFIIDTSRNGKGGIRAKWGSWCNVHGAGLGERPRADPSPGIDAYFWVKPPGESDGVSDAAQPRFDAMCGGPDATKGAPQAGQWFESYFLDLVRNAKPPL